MRLARISELFGLAALAVFSLFGPAMAQTPVAPDLVVSYVAPDTGNIVPLAANGAIPFPDTLVGASTSITISISNRGTGPGQVGSASLSGAASFRLTGLPLFPFTVAAGQDLRFAIRYSPTQRGPETTVLSLQVGGLPFRANASATALASELQYQVNDGTTVKTVKPGDVLTIPNAAIGTSSNVSIAVKNVGDADGAIASTAITGAGYQITDAPFLPVTLRAGATAVFTLAFTPTVTGEARGRLRLGNDSFDLLSQGLGPRLTYSYQVSGNTIAVLPGSSIIFPALNVTERSTIRFTIQNSGTARALISNISLSDTRGAFSLAGLPAFVATLEPNQKLDIPVTFAPQTVGNNSTTLSVDTANFTLFGAANQPPPLPSYSLTPQTANLGPLQQGTVTLTLASAYPAALTGALTLTVVADPLTVDPAVLFSNGTRTVAFTIPAGATQAVFPGNLTRAFFQTGTVASTITITPSFATQSGIDLTPATRNSYSLQIPSSAPRILAVQVTGLTTSGFTLTISGYATSRSLTRANVQFTPVAGVNVSNAQFALPLEQVAPNYFVSSAGQLAGGQFVLTIPFTIRTSNATPLPSQIFSAATVSLVSEVGSSDPVTAPIVAAGP